MSGAQETKSDTAKAFKEASKTEAVIRPTQARRKKRRPPLSIRVTDQEHERLKRDAAGESINGYIRQKIFGAAGAPQRAKRKPSVDRTALGRVLGKLGSSHLASNMNQIAKAANMGALPVSPELIQELCDACADIRAMRSDLLKALGVKPG